MAQVVFGHRHAREDPDPPLKRRQVVGTLPQADKKIAAGFDNICIDAFKRSMGDKGALLLVRLMKERPRALRKLQIDDHQIGDKGGQALFEFLATDKGLTSLEIGKNSLGPKSIRKCYDMLSVNKTITYLDLYSNKSIGETGGILIGSSLRVNGTLTGLCINDCNIPSKGMVAIADGVSENTTLTLLAAGGNCNNREVAKAFADSLEINKHLKSLILSGGNSGKKKIRDEGLISLCKSLQKNTTLQRIFLKNNGIKDKGIVEFAKLLAVNKALKIVDFEGNKIKEPGYYALIESLKVNNSIVGIGLNHTKSSMLVHLQTMVNQNAENQGIFAKTTFEDVLKDTTATGPLNRTKLMLIGQGRAGKTATVRALFGEPYDPEWKSTIAAALNVAKVSANTGWSKVQGKDKYKFAVDFAAGIALKDMEKHETKLVEEVQQVDKAPVAIGTDLAGNEEIQARPEQVDEEAAAISHQPSAHFLAPANDGQLAAPIEGYKSFKGQFHEKLLEEAELDRDCLKFTIWDYGGQRIFYSLHHLFMSKFGIYVLVFSMKELQDSHERGVAYLQFWLNSISLHAPETPLLLVGTFWDLLKKDTDLAELNTQVEAVLNNYPFNVVRNEEDENQHLSFFPISNKSGNGIGIVKETINSVARELDHVSMELPLSWIYVLEHLLTKRKRPYINLTDFRAVAYKFKIPDENEIMKMLDTFNDLGLVLHLTQTSALQQMIILKPQWLITNFGRVIRDETLHVHNQKFIKKNNLEEDVTHLFKDGLVSEDFLLMVWKEREIDYLLDMMRQTLMLCDWTFKESSVNAAGKVYYFVPSLVTGSKDIEDFDGKEEVAVEKTLQKLTYEDFLAQHEENLANFAFFKFGFLPDGVFDRLVCLCVAHANLLKVSKPPIVNNICVEICFGESETIRLYQEPQFDSIVMEIDDSSVSRAGHALLLVQSMLQKLRADIIGEGLNWQINFLKNVKEMLAYDEAVDQKLDPYFSEKHTMEIEVSTTDHIDVNKFLEGLQDL